VDCINTLQPVSANFGCLRAWCVLTLQMGPSVPCREGSDLDLTKREIPENHPFAYAAPVRPRPAHAWRKLGRCTGGLACVLPACARPVLALQSGIPALLLCQGCRSHDVRSTPVSDARI